MSTATTPIVVSVDGAGPEDLLRTTMDHVVPVVDGGGNSNANLRLAHRICNGTRGRVHYTLRHGMPLPARRDERDLEAA